MADNVPTGATVIHRSSRTSGELVFSYYVQDDTLYRVSDWAHDGPMPVTAHMLWRDEGLTLRMLGLE